ncbi:polysaccharide biosynthesis C-terminal domain-containing protein [Bradyrhizobium sp. CB1015]|uniref:polysaccharide biosynthesis C-terminal domain-containing protein n=1 Tax=Bradyrhizobium sp. CB1015 TaxID=2976822 RepID=UPI0021A99336|nr:polysaccharide biosynthesis C-terminal domain-containing protein [Bradyrhizobium sp. CB1015]UWU90655.1 polysaccharide biosynthesis C-terminal domain-containing protein [Bradyrhizobium sp. CB1015]
MRLLDLVTRPAVAGTVAALVLRALTLASRFLLSLLLARMLSPAEMGQYGLLTAALAFALLAVGLEFYSYTLRELVPATPERRARIIADQMVLGVAALVAVGIIVAGAIAAGSFPARLAPWFILILVTEHVSLEATRILIITWRPVRAYIGVFLRGGIWVYAIALLMFAAPSTRTLETVLVWWALGGVASIVFSAFSLSELPWRELRGYRPDLKNIREGLWTARPFMLTAAGALVISYVDRFVIDAFVGRDALGIYTFYSTILIGLLSLGSSVSHQFLPKVIAGYGAGLDAYRTALRSFFWSMLALVCATMILSAFAMAPMLALLGLSTYAASIGVFYAMLPGVFLRMLADVPSYALYAARSDKYLLICNLGSATVATVLNVALVPGFGIYGAALAGGIASAALFLSLVGFASHRMRESLREPGGTQPVGLPSDPDMLYP